MCLCALAFAASASAADDKVRVDLLSSPFGTGVYVISSAFETIVNKNDLPFTINHSESPGQAYNITKLTKDKNARANTVCLAGSSINWLAEQGKMPFKEKQEKMRPIATQNLGTVWLATQDKGLTSLESLDGKRIGMGRVPQALWGYIPKAVLEKGMPEDFVKSLKLQPVGSSEAATAFLNKQIDACVLGGYIGPENGAFEPSPQTVEVFAAGRDLNHIPWPKEAVEKTAAVDVPVIPYVLPPNSIPGVDKELPVVVDVQTFCVHEDFPEELAYQVTKALIDHVDEFAQYHALGKLMTKESLVYGIDPEEMHPGALRAYKEAGILK